MKEILKRSLAGAGIDPVVRASGRGRGLISTSRGFLFSGVVRQAEVQMMVMKKDLSRGHGSRGTGGLACRAGPHTGAAVLVRRGAVLGGGGAIGARDFYF